MNSISTDPRLIDTTSIPGRFVTIHTLRPVTGVNLNAGDDGAPKQMLIGDTNRLRVSSQARKRAMRVFTHDFINTDEQAGRTRTLPHLIATALHEQYSHDLDDAISAAAACLASVGATGFTITADTIQRTDETAFVPASAAPEAARIIHENWDDLADVRHTISVIRDEAAKANAQEGEKKKGRAAKADKVRIPSQPIAKKIKDALEAALAPGANLEIALNGRMLTALPKTGAVYAASSVAHSYSVDPITLLSDTWSVKDDWQDGDVFGAAHYATGRDARVLATGNLYEWACLDRDQLRTNLAAAYGDNTARLDAACADAERMFVTSACWAVPQSAQHTTGSMSAPVFALAQAMDAQPLTATTFQVPVTGDDVSTEAANRLCAYLSSAQRFAPTNGGVALWLPLAGQDAPTLPAGATYA